MECPLCSAELLNSFSVKHMTYNQCTNCGSIFLDSQCYLTPEGQRQRYTLHENSLSQKGYRTYLENFLTCSLSFYEEQFHTSPAAILDYGSGPEPCLVQLMKENGLNAYGWDPFFNPEGLSEQGCPGSFDLVTCLEVAEHFEDPAASFAHLAGLVAPGGVVVIGTNLIPDTTSHPFDAWWYRFDPTHVTFYTVQGLAAAGEKAGIRYIRALSDTVFAFRKL